MFAYIDYNFLIPAGSGSLVFNANATARNNSLMDSVNLTVIV